MKLTNQQTERLYQFTKQHYVEWYDLQTELGILIISILIISMLLVEYIILFQIPSKAEQYLKETYPEYELV